MNRLRSALSLRRDERGVALPLALGIGLVLLIMIAGAMTFAIGGLRKSSTDADSAAAAAAALAGVDEYRSRLSADSSYYRFGNPASAFTVATASTVNLPPAGTNPAFDIEASGGWAQVPGSTVAQFRYEIDNSDFGSSGILRLRSTGRVGESVRTVVANLKGKGFIDFLYFTDYEVQDPSLSLSGGVPTCTNLKYAWDPTPPARSGCTSISFGGNDTINGPVHSNDSIRICDATFTDKVTTSNPVAPHYLKLTGNTPTTTASSCSGQVFNPLKPPKFDDTVTMPETNTEMQVQTRIDMSADVPRPGCQYTGPTTITLNVGGTMTVRSPWTQFAHAGTTTAAAGVILPECGTPGISGLGSGAGQTIPIPENNLVFVQSVPATPGDPNYRPTTGLSSVTTPPSYSCTAGIGPGSGNGVGYPLVKAIGGTNRTEFATYGCRNGDVFLQGKLKGRLTIAAANSVYIVGNVEYAGGTTTNTDMLGIVGGKPVYIWNPAWRDSSNNLNLMNSPANRTIHAAVLSVENTFQVQNHNVGTPRGNLNVFGAIAQKFRGSVGTGSGATVSTGFRKNYNYDTRLKVTAPPKFLAPVSTTYGVTTMADVGPAFTADGTVVPLP